MMNAHIAFPLHEDHYSWGWVFHIPPPPTAGQGGSFRENLEKARRMAKRRFLSLSERAAGGYGFSVADIVSGAPHSGFPHRRKVGEARHWIMWMLHEEGFSYPVIARTMGLNNHTSVLYGVRKHEERMDEL